MPTRHDLEVSLATDERGRTVFDWETRVTAREEILRRVRDGLMALPDDQRTVPAPTKRHRDTPEVPPEDHAATVGLFIERLRYYGAQVVRISAPDIAHALNDALRAQGTTTVVSPEGLSREWLEHWAETDGNQVVPDRPHLSPHDLDGVTAVVTTCTGAVADSGTVVLDGGPGQGHRGTTLVPDCHICVVRADQIVSSLHEVLDRLDPRHPITFFSGPSATVDIETRDVHGPRRLVALIVE